MMQSGNPLSPAAVARRLVFILGCSALAKLIYVFGLTDYSNYVFSDMGHYFYRAQSMLEGNVPYHYDWDVFPMGVTTLLALYWKVLDVIGLHSHLLLKALTLNVLASTVCVGLVFHLALRLTERTRLALCIALAYGFFYPLIYLSAFVLSEAAAQLFFLLSLSALIEASHRKRPALWLILAGLFWGLTCQCRGAFLPCAAPLALVLWLHAPAALGRFKSLASFGAGAVAVFFAAGFTLWAVTDGASHKPTGANGGFNFFLQQCHYHGAYSVQDNFTWQFEPAPFAKQPELGTFYTTVPFPDQGFYYREALRCLAEQPGALKRFVAFAPTMLYSQFYPDRFDAQGYGALMPVIRHLNVLLLLLSPAGYLALRKRQPMAARLLLWSGLTLWATAALFNADHRHIYGFSFATLLLGIPGLLALIKAPWLNSLRYVSIAAAVTALAVYLFAGKGPWALYDYKPVTIKASLIDKPVPNGTPWYSLDALRFWAPVRVELGALRHAKTMHLSLDDNDVYELGFWQGTARVGRVHLALAEKSPVPLGLIRRNLKLPTALVEKGFDAITVTPISGDGSYSMAGLELAD